MDLLLRHSVEYLVGGREPDDAGAPCNELLADYLATHGFIRSPELESAVRSLPRHHFVPGADLRHVYCDRAVATLRDERGWIASSCSAPSIVVAMIEALQLEGEHRILELGAGTGYNAALMASMDPRHTIVTCDVVPPVAETAAVRLADLGVDRVRVLCGDGSAGSFAEESFDRMILTCSTDDIRPHWSSALREAAVVVAPIEQIVHGLRRTRHGFVGRPLFIADFIGDHADKQEGSWIAPSAEGVESGHASATWGRVDAGAISKLMPLLDAEPVRTMTAPATTSSRVAATLLRLSIEVPDRFIQVTEYQGGWAFGLAWPEHGAMVVCRVDGEFAFRHYPAVEARPKIDWYGDVFDEDLWLELMDLLSAGGPSLSDLTVLVRDRETPVHPAAVFSAVRRHHRWDYLVDY